jgi:probable HAF family extracellular repeat protein
LRSRPLTLERLEERSLLSYTVTDLGTFGAVAYANGINSAGQVAGYSSFSPLDGHGHAFLWDHGVMNDLGTLPGGTYSSASAINDLGQVVGTADAAGTPSQGFLWDQGTMRDLGALGGDAAFAYGVNDVGQVVGESATLPGPTAYHACLWQNGTITDLGTLGGGGSFANGISNAGDVVGGAALANGRTHAFLYRDGVMTDLGAPPGNTDTTAYAINGAGQVVGTAEFDDDPPPYNYYHALLWQDGTMTDLGTLGGPSSEAVAINDAGDMVGGSQLPGSPGSYPNVGFLYHHGVLTDLNTLLVPGSGWTIVAANGINDAGQIIGVGIDAARFQHAVLLTPTRHQPPQGQPLPDPVAVQGFAVPLPPRGLGSAPSPADGQPVPNPPAAEIPAGRVLRDPSPADGVPAVATLKQEVNVSPWVGGLGDSAMAVAGLVAFPG